MSDVAAIIELMLEQRAILRERLTELDLEIARLRGMEPDAPHVYKPAPQPAAVQPTCQMIRSDSARIEYHGVIQQRRLTILGYLINGQNLSAEIAKALGAPKSQMVYNDLLYMRAKGWVRQRDVHSWEATEAGAAMYRESA